MAYINNTAAQMPYLLSAYGLAVKHGYPGTEEDWLASLKGEKGDTPLLQFDDESGYLQYRYSETANWVNLASLDELMTEGEEAVVAAAKEYADLSEAYAKGTVDGDDVSSGDPGYQDNAKYYADLADDSATAAANHANNAESSTQAAIQAAYNAATSASDAQDSAVSASASSYNAASSASNASSSAGQAGTYVETALTYRNAAYSAAADSQYYAQEAQNYAGAASNSASSAATYASSAATSASGVEAYADAAVAAQTAAEAAQTAAETAETHAETAQDKAEDAQEAAETAQAAAEAVLESIPEDYSAMSADVTDLKSAINNNPLISMDVIRWYSGSISASDGTTASHVNRRTIPMIHAPLGVKCTSDAYEYGIYVYSTSDTTNYLGVWNGSTYIHEAYWYRGTVSLVNIPQNYYIRIVLKGIEAGTAPTDAADVMFAYIDKADYELCQYNRDIPISFMAGNRAIDGTVQTSTTFKTYYATTHRYFYVGKGNTIKVTASKPFNYHIAGSDESSGALVSYENDPHADEFVTTTDYISINLTQTNPETSGQLPIGTNYNDINLNREFRISYKNPMVGLERFVDYPDSITKISGAEVTNRGIKFTKISNFEFVISGQPTTTNYYKTFDVLLDNDSPQGFPEVHNLTETDTYTLNYELSDPTKSKDILFAITTSDVGARQYIQSGQSFEVNESLPATLFIYVSTTATFSSAVTVQWVLYKGKDKIGYPLYTETVKDIVARTIAQNAIESLSNYKAESVPSWGESNAMANVQHIDKIQWTPIAATMPKGSNYWDINVTATGIPYSSAREVDKMVGLDVSLHTFMTAVHDPRSVLYTRRLTVDNGSTYYGSVCSAFASYVYSLGLNLTSRFLMTWDEFDTIPMQDLKVLDLICIHGHSAVITGIEKDDFGRITYVTVTEEWGPATRTRRYSWANFLSNRDGYIARRYKHLNGVTYTPTPYVQCFDESPVEIVYPNVQTEFGDRAVFMNGDNVNIHVITNDAYTSIEVRKDGELVSETTDIDDFTLYSVQPGLYTITAVGETNSESTFYVVGATCSFDSTTGIVEFTSTNATPTMIGVYNLPADRNVSIEPHILTAEEITNGQANVSDLITTTRKYAKVIFMTNYGTAVWYCPEDTATRWVPIT